MNTDKLSGTVMHCIIKPESLDTIWNLIILDKEGDELVEIRDHVGRLDDREGLFLGKDAQEKLTLSFNQVSKNEPIKVIFKTQEL